MSNDRSDNELLIAFVQGAKWWEWYRTGGAMRRVDEDIACRQAEERLENRTLGINKVNHPGTTP